MSECNACGYHGSSSLYQKDDNTPVIALLGQPNSGKSTIFNMITGSHQHVGNWPGKTVDQKEGEFHWNGKRMILADLPGSYSLSAGSDEEVITRNYIAAGNADLVLVMADASQLKRSLYMLADFVGSQVPALLVLNMMDVAKGQGITIHTDKLSEKLGIPVVPMSAIRKKDYAALYTAIERSLAQKPIISGSTLHSAEEKMAFIDRLLDGVLITPKTVDSAFTAFDRKALSPVRGKLMAFGIILGIFLLAMVFAGIVSGAASAVITPAFGTLRSVMEHFSVHPLLISLVCDVFANVLYFACMMASFVLGITFGFNLMEETGYLARISFLFDHTMTKVGLQGKTIMPFFMGLGCTIAGTTGTRVVDNWGQRVLAIAMSWAVPCAATLSVVPTIAIALFGSTGGFLVIVSIFLFMFLMMWIVYRIFGSSLSPKDELVGLIMECVSALAATARETHSVKWTAKIGAFYTTAALLVSCIVYYIGLLIF